MSAFRCYMCEINWPAARAPRAEDRARLDFERHCAEQDIADAQAQLEAERAFEAEVLAELEALPVVA